MPERRYENATVSQVNIAVSYLTLPSYEAVNERTTRSSKPRRGPEFEKRA